MAKSVKFELNRSGVRELMQSAAMASIVNEAARKMQTVCGDGYEVTTQSGKTRVNAEVHAATPHAYYSNLKHNTLEKAKRSVSI